MMCFLTTAYPSCRIFFLTVGVMAFLVDYAKTAPVISITRGIATGDDDGEEYRTNTLSHHRGEVTLHSSDLELCRESLESSKDDPRWQYVGLRFIDVAVPQGATIERAVVEFVVDSPDSNSMEGVDKEIVLMITGEYVDNAARFSTEDFDISSRTNPGTPNVVTWVEKEKWKDYTTRSTTDISPIIQDIVSRSGWRSGNALVLVLYGTTTDRGTRVAHSRQAGADLGPKLKLDYSLDASPTFNPTPSPTQNGGAAPCPTRDPNGIFSRGCITRPRGSPSRTISPTPVPTLESTQLPTRQPTNSPTSYPTKLPTLSPTLNPTPSPTIEPTVLPTQTPTFKPTSNPTLKPTPSPTPLPTLSLTPLPTQVPTRRKAPDQQMASRGTGEACSENSQCKSTTCRSGVCMASPACYPVKHTYGQQFDKNSVNLVFVASAFDKTTHEAWRVQVNTTYAAFGKFKMFSEDIERLNVLLVDPVELSSSFCSYGCVGIDRLLCCDTEKAQSLSSQCFPVGSNLQTVVIHNDEKYGGAGYTDRNLATVSTNAKGPLVAIHELGHSLFELGDEYSYGPSNDRHPNCAATSSCSKWSDLIENTPKGYDQVSCVPGCRNGNFFTGGASYMNDLSAPVGAVNERFTCCTYQALTKSMPSYCDVFDFSPNYLFEYCQTNDYQHYGKSNYDVDTALRIKAPLVSKSVAINDNVKYVFVTDPLLVKIKLRKNGKATVKEEPMPLPPGMYLKAHVVGDFRSIKHSAKLGVESVVRVKVIYGTGKDLLFFSRNTTIEVPFSPDLGKEARDGVPRSVSQKSNVIDVILDTMGRKLKKVRPHLLKTKKTTVST